MRKYDYISMLAEETAQEVSRNVSNALLNMDERGDNAIGMEMEESSAEMLQVAENSTVKELIAYGVSMPQENGIVAAFKSRTEQLFQNIGGIFAVGY